MCIGNCLIPGLGFALCKDYSRAALLFVSLNGCYLAGMAWGGYVLAPQSWVPMTPEFNLVTALTYLTQAFHGSGWLLQQALQIAGGRQLLAEEPGFFARFALQRMGALPYSDLGCFHLIVAGGLNYFATVRLYDLTAGVPEMTANSFETGGGGKVTK